MHIRIRTHAPGTGFTAINELSQLNSASVHIHRSGIAVRAPNVEFLRWNAAKLFVGQSARAFLSICN